MEKLCLLESKISEIENLFQVTEKAYRKLIDSLFVNHKFLTEIDECLAYNYPITTQECMLSLTCEKNSSKDSKSTSTPEKGEFERVDEIFKRILIIEEEVEGKHELPSKSSSPSTSK